MGYYTPTNNFKLKLIDLSDNTSVASGGGTNTQTLQPSPSKIYQIIGLNINIPDPAGSSANSHTLAVDFQNCSNDKNILYAVSGFGNAITFNQNQLTANTTERPSNDREQWLLANGGHLYSSYDQPIDFKYTNDTDVNQTGTRTIEVFVLEHNEGT